MARQKPNIIITGTPGVGKSNHCELLAQNTGLKHMSINRIVKEHDCHQGWDSDLESWIVDEDKVRRTISVLRHTDRGYFKLLDTIEADVNEGGQIIEWHACEIFPQSWIDLVVVLRTDSTLLYDRLLSRSVVTATKGESVLLTL
jgi:adenylate kinase